MKEAQEAVVETSTEVEVNKRTPKRKYRRNKKSNLASVVVTACAGALVATVVYVNNQLNTSYTKYIISNCLDSETVYSEIDSLNDVTEDSVCKLLVSKLKDDENVIARDLKVTISDDFYTLDSPKYDVHLSYPKNVVEYYKHALFYRLVEVLEDLPNLPENVDKDAYVSLVTEKRFSSTYGLDFKCSYSSEANTLHIEVLNSAYDMNASNGEVTEISYGE